MEKGASGVITTVAAYVAAQPLASRRVLRLVRTAIRGALPGAEESISYRIPTYKMRGKPVMYFAGWARHYFALPRYDRRTVGLRYGASGLLHLTGDGRFSPQLTGAVLPRARRIGRAGNDPWARSAAGRVRAAERRVARVAPRLFSGIQDFPR